MADTPTYHISIWDIPVSYLCQICNLQGQTKDAILAHLTTDHSATPVPTMLAADYERQNPVFMELLHVSEPDGVSTAPPAEGST